MNAIPSAAAGSAMFYSRDPSTAQDADLQALARAFDLPCGHNDVLAQLMDTARLVQCKAGYLALATPRRPEPSWWLLRSGRLVLGTHKPDGSFVERKTLQPGQWLDVGGAQSGNGQWLEDAYAPVPFELLALPLDALAQACAREPALALALMRVAARALREQHQRCDDLVAVDATARVARWLMRLADEQCQGESPVTLRLAERKCAVAQRLNLQAETLSRSLAELRRAGLVRIDGYEVQLRDLAALKAVAFPMQRRQAPQGKRPLRSDRLPD